MKVKASFLQNVVWFLSNCVRATPGPEYWKVGCITSIFGEALMKEDVNILSDSLWGVNYMLTKANDFQARKILEKVNLKRVIELLGYDSPNIVSPALRILASLAGISSRTRKALLSCSVFEILATILKAEDVAIVTVKLVRRIVRKFQEAKEFSSLNDVIPSCLEINL